MGSGLNGRRQHLTGRRHINNKIEYYQMLIRDKGLTPPIYPPPPGMILPMPKMPGAPGAAAPAAGLPGMLPGMQGMLPGMQGMLGLPGLQRPPGMLPGMTAGGLPGLPALPGFPGQLKLPMSM